MNDSFTSIKNILQQDIAIEDVKPVKFDLTMGKNEANLAKN